MSQFLRIASGIDVTPIMLELHRAPHLWDQHTIRKTFPGTPHAAMSDIWARMRPQAELVSQASYREPYRCEFYPAWRELPSLRPLVFNLMARVQGVELGSVLITKLPPGGEILPHSDRGAWSAEWHNCKVHVTLAGQSLSSCADEVVTMRAGEAWTFDNLQPHDVKNPAAEDRIVVIVSMRVEA